MQVKQMNQQSKLPGKNINRCWPANLSPPKETTVKELVYASMSGIIPGRLHLCRACFRFIPAKQI